ncbi:MAG: hypothetical protein ACP5G1_02175 [Nanopusillaceae archaeon]
MNKEEFIQYMEELKKKYKIVPLSIIYSELERKGVERGKIKYWLKTLDGTFFKVENWNVIFIENG